MSKKKKKICKIFVPDYVKITQFEYSLGKDKLKLEKLTWVCNLKI